MGGIIRRSITITIIETWTIVWAPDDDPLCHPTAIVQHLPETQEEPDEAIQATLIAAESGKLSASEPTPSPNLPAAMLDPQPDDMPTRPAISGRSRRSARRKARSTVQSD
jgi:hypothetical protein